MSIQANLIVQAKSGTGKTCVFTVIALESVDVNFLGIQVLVLAPTREIALQIQDVVKTVGKTLSGLRCQTFIGGLPVLQDKVLAKKCHIAVGTPGRVKQLIEIGAIETTSIRLFVLDEADILLEGDFQEPINWIYSKLPENKQILALSATYPEYLAYHLTAYMRNPTFVRLNTADPALLGIKQFHISVPNHALPIVVFNSKAETVIKLLSSINFQQCLIFSNMQNRAKNLQSELQSRNWPTACIAGCLDQKERNFAMEQLKTYKCRILISTDLTSRGIDADKVNLVINMDIPADHETYLHRIGRGGRFGSHGAAITIITADVENKQLRDIEKKCNTKIKKLPDPIPRDLIARVEAISIDDIVISEQIINQPIAMQAEADKMVESVSQGSNSSTIPCENVEATEDSMDEKTRGLQNSTDIDNIEDEEIDCNSENVCQTNGASISQDLPTHNKSLSREMDEKKILADSEEVPVDQMLQIVPKKCPDTLPNNKVDNIFDEFDLSETVHEVDDDDDVDDIMCNELLKNTTKQHVNNTEEKQKSSCQENSSLFSGCEQNMAISLDQTNIKKNKVDAFEALPPSSDFASKNVKTLRHRRAPRSYAVSDFVQSVNDDLLSLRIKDVGAGGDNPVDMAAFPSPVDSSGRHPMKSNEIIGQRSVEDKGDTLMNSEIRNQCGATRMPQPSEDVVSDAESSTDEMCNMDTNLTSLSSSFASQKFSLKGDNLGTTESTQSLQDNVVFKDSSKAIPHETAGVATQKEKYNVVPDIGSHRSQVDTESVTELTNQSQLGTESVSELTNEYPLHTESVTGSTNKSHIDMESVAELTSKSHLDTEIVSELTDNYQAATESVAGSTNKSHIDIESVAELTSKSQLNTESVSELTDNYQVDTESVAESTNKSHIDIESVTDLNKNHFDTESVADLSKKSTINTKSVTDLSNKSPINTESVTDLSFKSHIDTESVADLSNKSHIDTESVADLSNKSHIDTESVADLSSKSQIDTDSVTEMTNKNLDDEKSVIDLTNESHIDQESVIDLTNESHIDQESVTDLTNESHIDKESVTDSTNVSHVASDLTAKIPAKNLKNATESSNLSDKPNTVDFNDVTSTLNFFLEQQLKGSRPSSFDDLVADHKSFSDEFDKDNIKDPEVAHLFERLELKDTVRWQEVFDNNTKKLEDFHSDFNNKLKAIEAERLLNKDNAEEKTVQPKSQKATNESRRKSNNLSGKYCDEEHPEEHLSNQGKGRGKKNKGHRASDSLDWRGNNSEHEMQRKDKVIPSVKKSVEKSDKSEEIATSSEQPNPKQLSKAGSQTCESNPLDEKQSESGSRKESGNATRHPGHQRSRGKDKECQALDDMHEMMMKRRQEQKRLKQQNINLASAAVVAIEKVICPAEMKTDIVEESKEVNKDVSHKDIDEVKESLMCNSTDQVKSSIRTQELDVDTSKKPLVESCKEDQDLSNVKNNSVQNINTDDVKLNQRLYPENILSYEMKKSVRTKKQQTKNILDAKVMTTCAEKTKPKKPSKTQARLAGLEVSAGSTSSSSYFSLTSDVSDVMLSDMEPERRLLKPQCYANKYVEDENCILNDSKLSSTGSVAHGHYSKEDAYLRDYSISCSSPYVPNTLPSPNLLGQQHVQKAKESLINPKSKVCSNSSKEQPLYKPTKSSRSTKEKVAIDLQSTHEKKDSKHYSKKSTQKKQSKRNSFPSLQSCESDTESDYSTSRHHGPSRRQPPSHYPSYAWQHRSFEPHFDKRVSWAQPLPVQYANFQPMISPHVYPLPLQYFPQNYYTMYNQGLLQLQYIKTMTKVLTDLHKQWLYYNNQ